MRRWAPTILVMVLLALSSPCALAAGHAPALVLHVDDRVRVPPDELAKAMRVAGQIFAAAGLDISWAEGRFPLSIRKANAERPDSRHVPVQIVNYLLPASRGAAGCPLGMATPPLAYVFYNRIVELSAGRPVDRPVVLGRVIAHEVAHLLLPENGHSSYGIMRADLDLDVTNPNLFTSDQALAFKAALARTRDASLAAKK